MSAVRSETFETNCSTVVGRLCRQNFTRGEQIAFHRHDDPYISFVYSGEYLEAGPKAEKHCQPLSVIVHPEGDAHANRFLRDSVVLSLFYKPSWREEQGTVAADIRGETFKSPAVANLFHKIFSEMNAGDSFSGLILDGLTLELAGEVERLNARGGNDLTPDPAQQVLDYLHCNKGMTITLEEMQKDLNLRKEALSKSFKKATGLTIGEYLRKLRVNEAMQLLSGTDMPISEVALEAGFYDQAHFNKAFKRETNTTPLVFRKKHTTH